MKVRFRPHRSISTTMVAAFSLLIAVVTLFITARSYTYTRTQLQETATDYTAQLISQVNAELDMYVEYIQNLADLMVENPLMQAYLQHGPEEPDPALTARVQELLSTTEEIRQEISAVALLSDDQPVLFGDADAQLNPYADYRHTDWYLGALEAPEEVFVSSSHVENLVYGQYPWVVSLSKAVLDFSGQVNGVLLLDLNYQVIDAICANIDLGNRGYIFLLDRAGEILWHPQQQLINANLKTENTTEIMGHGPGSFTLPSPEGDKLYLTDHSQATGWTAVGVADPNELLQNPSQVYREFVVISIIAVLLAFLFSVLISRAITTPLRRLTTTMQRVEQGDFSVRSSVRSGNEVGRLSENFNHMLSTIQDLMHQQIQIEEQKRQSEWNLLQAQIKPHFIYNTLDSIIWMSHAGQNEKVVEMTSALAHLLRNSIGSGKDIISLGEEINHIESYLTIQKMRYQEKLHFELDIDPATRPYQLPRLVLQPLVENAIYHGIKPRETGGTVRVTSMLDEEQLLITVEDDGVGMTADQLAHILDRKTEDESSSKIGVYNVHERLRHYFGEAFCLKYFSEVDKGTTAMLVLPLILPTEGDAEHESS